MRQVADPFSENSGQNPSGAAAKWKTREAIREARERAWIAEMDAEPERLGFCYFAGHRGLVKIGFSVEVDRRLSEIRNQYCLDSIDLLATARGHRYREAHYHQKFAADRLHGEWFRLSPAIQDEIDKLNAVPVSAKVRSPQVAA